MVWSDTTRGMTARARNRLDTERRVDVRALAAQVLGRFGEQGDVLAEHGAAGLQGREHAVARFAGVVAESPQRAQASALAEQRERGRVDVELVAQRGEHGVGHLCGVRCRGQGPCHRLHALGRFGRHPPPSLVPRLGTRGPQLHVALAAQVGDPHGQRRGGELGHDAERVVQLPIAVRRRADDEREEGRQDADQGDSRRPGEGSGDERADGEQPDEGDVAAEDGEEDGDGGDPEQGDHRGDRLGAVGALAAASELKVVVSWFWH